MNSSHSKSIVINDSSLSVIDDDRVIGNNNTIRYQGSEKGSLTVEGNGNCIYGVDNITLNTIGALIIKGNNNTLFTDAHLVIVRGDGNATSNFLGDVEVQSLYEIGSNNHFHLAEKAVPIALSTASLRIYVEAVEGQQDVHKEFTHTPSRRFVHPIHNNTRRATALPPTPLSYRRRRVRTNVAPISVDDDDDAPAAIPLPTPSSSSNSSSAPAPQINEAAFFQIPEGLSASKDEACDGADATACTLCYEKKRRIVFIPCGHRGSCIGCTLKYVESKQLNSKSTMVPCPFCKVPSTQVVATIDS